jgi:hypothetical protein
LLRHDVDLSLRLALEMAELECKHDVFSTFFILPHNDFYSPFAAEGRRHLVELCRLGHEIGLHWDSSLLPDEPDAFRRCIRRDLDALEEIIGCKIVSASQHNPIDSRHLDISDMIEIEAYSSRLRDRFAYVSDSAMAWRAATPWDFLVQKKDMQFLSHPVWWMTEGNTRADKLNRFAADEAAIGCARISALLAYMDQCLTDRERLDSELVERWSANKKPQASSS